MVQGGLLTAHPGGVHGYGRSPGGVPPSGRVPEQLLQAAPILKRRRRRYRGEFAAKRSILGVSTPRAKYMRRGAPGGSTSQPGGWGRATCPPGWLGVALLRFLDYSGSFRCANFLSDLFRIFGALLMAGKPKIKKQQKTATGNWVH